jgi:D-alanine-D-alanine ligase-like ATP-grasp enzyme
MIYKLYVGSNNKTKKLESTKAINITSKRFQGFTTYQAKGYWQGKAEKTLIIEIESKQKKEVLALAKELTKKLKQDAVGITATGKMQFISL